jgi:hypothetical protein
MTKLLTPVDLQEEPLITKTRCGGFMEFGFDIGTLVALDSEELAMTASINLRKFLGGGLERVFPTHDWICWLLGKRNTQSHECGADLAMPHCDHPRAFRNPKTGERVVIHQPYVCDADTADCTSCKTLIRDSAIFAEKHGLTVRIDRDTTFYFPTQTALVEYRVKKLRHPASPACKQQT